MRKNHHLTLQISSFSSWHILAHLFFLDTEESCLHQPFAHHLDGNKPLADKSHILLVNTEQQNNLIIPSGVSRHENNNEEKNKY